MSFHQEPQSASPATAGWIAPEFRLEDRQRALLHALFDGHPDMVVLADAEGRIVGANAGAMAGFGYLRERLENQPVEMLLPEPLRARHVEHTRQFMEHPSQRMMGTGLDLKARDAAGREFRVDVLLHPMKCGEEQYVMAICRRLDTDLARSQTLMQALVHSVTDYAIYMLDPEGRVVTWNEGAERVKGYTAHEVLGRDYSIFFLPEDVEAGAPQQELASAEWEGRYETEAWRLRKDGTKFWALVTLTAIRDENGALRGFAKVTRDLTAQKFAQEAERRQNAQLERLRIIVGNVGEYGIYTMDAEGRVNGWSATSEKDTGYSEAEAMGMEYSMLATEEDRLAGLPQKELEDAARTGRSARDSWKVRHDGSLFWAVGALTAIRDEAGNLTGYVRMGRDMTRQKRAEEALQELNKQLERYRVIIESVGDYAIYTLDAEGKIDSWSAGSAKLLGYTSEEAIGRNYSLSFTPDEIAAGTPRQELEEAARNGRCATDNWRLRRDGVIHWVSGVLTAIRDETGKLTGYIRVARDMTEKKMLEDSLAGMAAELERRVADRTRELEASMAELQSKNQEVEAFVYTVSHDLRAPLVNVQGFVRELEQSCRNLRTVIRGCPRWEQCWPGVTPILDEEIAGALHYISASMAKFERLITALLNLSRQGRQVYQMMRVNVWELATNAVSTFQQLIAEAGAEVEVGQLPATIADATALGQVFSNLIGNCLKYRSPGRPLRVEVGGRVEGDKVHYWVRDNGLGIPESGQARLFQVFQRFHAQLAQGEGMGLAIVHRIVERHGGKIWAESREGEGTAMHFVLPGLPQASPTGGAA